MERKRPARSIQATVIGSLSILAFGCGQNKEQAAPPPPVVKTEVQPKTTTPPSTPVIQQTAVSRPVNGAKPDSKDKKITAANKPASTASSTTHMQTSMSFTPDELTADKPAVMGAEGIGSGGSMFGGTNREMEQREADAQAQLDRENSLRQMMNQNIGGYKVRSAK